MATFTLTDLKNSVAQKYAPTVIENGADTYTLQNPLQLPEKARDKVENLLDGLTGEESTTKDMLKVFREVVVLVTEESKGKELLGLLGDNDPLLIELVSSWMEDTQLGEVAGSSES